MSFDFSHIISRFAGTQTISQQKSRQIRRRRRLQGVEGLEARTMLTAPLVADVLQGNAGTTVFGTVYEDLNSDGVKNAGENGISGWTVYLDLDQSGTLNNDAAGTPEPSAVTDVDGDYVISHLIPGTYRVGEVVQAGWTPTASVFQDVSVRLDRDTRANFFNFSGGDITGTVWNDLDHDGTRATDPTTGEFTEPGLADWTIFLDLNNNRVADPGEPMTLTDANGVYSFVNLPPDDYEVTEQLPEGWEPTRTFDIRQTAGVVAREAFVQDFANFSLVNGAIQGSIWNDLNGDGNRAADPTTGEFTDPGLAGWTVFIDVNEDGIPQPDEPTTTTDDNGQYSFISLAAGDHKVTEVLPDGWYVSPTFDTHQTVAVTGGEVATAGDFANFTIQNGSIRGTVWNDLNRDGIRDVNLAGDFTEPGLQNWQVFLDLNRNRLADAGEPVTLTDTSGMYFFLDLQVGDYELQEVLPTGWETTATYDDSQTVTVFSGTESVARDFANFNLSTAVPGSVAGTIWNDLNGNGIRDTDAGGTTFTDPGLADWVVFVDVNSNGVLDATEPKTTSGLDGTYTISGVAPGTTTIVVLSQTGWRATAPVGGRLTLALRNAENATGLDFGNYSLQEAVIRGTVFADSDKDGIRGAAEVGLSGIAVYLDLNNNGLFDVSEPQMMTSTDLFFTPAIDEAGTYAFTHLAAGTYTVRTVVPDILSATPAAELTHTVTLTTAEQRSGINTAAVFRPSEIHGTKFDDLNGNHQRDAGEPVVAGATIFVDLDRDNVRDADEPTTATGVDGTYSFTNLTPGAYVVREVLDDGYIPTFPNTVGGILWPEGTSNPAIGAVTPTSITTSLAEGATYQQTVSITLPNTGSITNLVDVFLLFDDTGSFVNNSPIVRAAFPAIIAQLQAALPGIDLGFGVGRFEEYANFAGEYSTGRPFILNQPIVAASTSGYMTAIEAALNRTTPGYGGDQPETDIEALYQLVTGVGFDGNNNGTVLDSGVAGLASTQLNPGDSGDVPSFASFQADVGNSVLQSAGNVGGGGFRAGALPIILTATDTGFAFQPRGESSITGVGGVTLPVSALSETSRPNTPFDSGAGIQQTITALNALGALVIGLGTNPESTLDPRQGLEALSQLTGAVNRSTTTIDNGTADPIAPGDPLYFQIASGFSASVANGVVQAIQNAATNVAVDIEVRATDPRVKIVNHTGVKSSIAAGQTASFDIEFIGDGVPHRFDLQFVRAGTNVVLGSIPVVLGTPIVGNGYEFEDLEAGEIHQSSDFGSRFTAGVNQAPVAADGVLTALQGVPTNGTLVAADSDSALLTYRIDVLPSHGTVIITDAAFGTYTYTPAADYSGPDNFTFKANDGSLDSNAATVSVTVTVTASNRAPTATDGTLSVVEDTVTSGTLSATDSDSNPLTFSIVAIPNHGTVVITNVSTGAYTYTPATNYFGPDSFTFQANDGTVNSNTATVTIDVSAVNDAPVATDGNGSTAEDTAVIGNLSASDVDSGTLIYSIVDNANHGTVVITNASTGAYTYTPATNYFGPDSFTFQANDGTVNSNTATVTIDVSAVNDAPVATDGSGSTAEDAALIGNLLASDIDSGTLIYSIVANANHGTVVITNASTGAYTYTPTTNYFGPDSFTFQANDGTVNSSTATINVSVTSVNDPPVSNPDSYTATAGTTLNVPLAGVLANDQDVDGNSLTAVLVTNVSHGTLTLNANGSFSYTPQVGFTGADSFAYRANDGTVDGPATTVSLTVNAAALPQFAVVDDSLHQMFTYGTDGKLASKVSLPDGNRAPRGIATNADGSRIWIADEKGVIFVYDAQQKLIGSWKANGLSHIEGITTNGIDIWLVDSKTDAIHRFAGACTRLSGDLTATSKLTLNSANKNSTDIVTDGVHFWVLNAASSGNRVFRYSMSGVLEGSWTIDRANSKPTGLALNPADPSQFWILDAKSRKVFLYVDARSRTGGSQNATSSVILAATNRKAEGLMLLLHSTATLPPAAHPAATNLLDALFTESLAL